MARWQILDNNLPTSHPDIDDGSMLWPWDEGFPEIRDAARAFAKAIESEYEVSWIGPSNPPIEPEEPVAQ